MTTSAEDHWLTQQNEFDRVCATLRTLDAALLDRPLAHFLRPVDRCVPDALPDLKLAQIAQLTVDDLRSMTGVGHVKIANLTAVLRRVVEEAPQFDAAAHPAPVAPAEVDEVHWEQWRTRIRAHGLGGEYLGRFVESLRELRRGLWFSPLDEFLDRSLDELRRLRGFGAKRIGAILQVFQTLDELLSIQERDPARPLLLGPWRIATADAYLAAVSSGRVDLTAREFERSVVTPILEQLQYDAGRTTFEVVADRLNIVVAPPAADAAIEPGAPAVSCHERFSRPYRLQLLADAATLLQCRWPRGEALAEQTLERLAHTAPGVPLPPIVAQSFAVFFPQLKSQIGGVAHSRTSQQRAARPQFDVRSPAGGPGLRAGA